MNFTLKSINGKTFLCDNNSGELLEVADSVEVYLTTAGKICICPSTSLEKTEFLLACAYQTLFPLDFAEPTSEYLC